MGAHRLRRRGDPHPARGGAAVLRPRAAVARLSVDRAARGRRLQQQVTRRLVLLRHGQTEWNSLGRAQGHADISLDATGHARAAAAAPYLAAMRPVRLWSSDLARAQETAAYVADAAGLTVETDPRLREYDVGV